MASLTNQQIDLTYDALLKLKDNDALTGVYKIVTDGLGNETYVQLKTGGVILSDPSYNNGVAVDNTGVLFIGDVDFQSSNVDFTNATVTGLPSPTAVDSLNTLTGDLTLAAGTGISITDNGSDQITITATGGGGGGTDANTAYNNNILSPYFSGYPASTYAKPPQPYVGRPYLGQIPDWNPDRKMFVRLYGEVGSTITTFHVPLYSGSTGALSVALYEADATTGLPTTLVTLDTFATNGSDMWYTATLSSPRVIATNKQYWVGIQSTGQGVGCISGDHAINITATFGAWGGAVGGLIAYNTLMDTTPTWANYASNYSWGGREELLFPMWK